MVARHLDGTDEIQGDSFFEVALGSVEGQNLHDLSSETEASLMFCTNELHNNARCLPAGCRQGPTCWLDRAVQL